MSDNILRSKLTRKKSLCYPFTQLLSVSVTFLHSTAEYRCVTAKSEKNSLSRCTLETDELLRCFTCTKPHASLLSACWPLDSNNMSPRSAPSLTVLSASGADELNWCSGRWSCCPIYVFLGNETPYVYIKKQCFILQALQWVHRLWGERQEGGSRLEMFGLFLCVLIIQFGTKLCSPN